MSPQQEEALGIAMLKLARAEKNNPRCLNGSAGKSTPKTVKRMERVLELSQAGKSVAEIAMTLSVSHHAVCRDRRQLERDGRFIRRHVNRGPVTSERVKSRREEVLRLTQSGLDSVQIAARLGFAKSTIREDWAALRQEGRL